jgi:uncharacterized protein (DUF1778 family)
VGRRLTKIPMQNMTVRILPRDLDLLYEAAKREGVSQSQFLRDAVRERAQRTLEEVAAK